MNLAMLLEMAAEAFPERVAVSCDGANLRYAELNARATALAGRIRAAGAGSVAYVGVNGLAAPVALYAAARAGVPYAPLNYRLARAELAALSARLPAPLVITDDTPRDSASAARSDPTSAIAPSDDPHAVAIQLFTSGTTGVPKAALLRHEHLVAYILGSVEFGAAREDEAALVAVPPYHVAGIAAMLSGTYAGRRSVMLPSFDAAAWLGLCSHQRVTQAFLVPTMLARITDELARGAPAPATLRSIAYGGGPMPAAVIDRAMRLLPDVEFTNAYGLTETSSTICLLGPEDHRAAMASDMPDVRRRLRSVGRPLPSVEVEVRDERGAPVGRGSVGALHVRGAQVAGEYGDVGSTLDAAGWFATRDRGWIDEAGYVFLDGRADDLIVRGGENISPGEIEAVLCAHPAVVDAAVVALPSDEWGETVAAVVVPAAGASVSVEALRQWVRERLRSSRVPEMIRFRAALPYNETGKLVRRVLRDELRDAEPNGFVR